MALSRLLASTFLLTVVAFGPVFAQPALNTGVQPTTPTNSNPGDPSKVVPTGPFGLDGTISARPLRIQDYGALCNGASATQDQNAWNAAYSIHVQTMQDIHIPSGVGCVLGGITVGVPTRIVGDGGPYGQATIMAATPTTTVFDFTSSWSAIENVAFNPVSGKQTAGAYIKVEATASRFRSDKITMSDFYKGIWIAGTVSTADIKNTRAFIYSTTSVSHSAIHVQGGLDIKIDGLTTQAAPGGTVSGIDIENVGDMTITNADVIGMGTDLNVHPGNGQSVTSLWVANSFFDTAMRGIDMCPTGTGQILRSKLTSVWGSSHTTNGLRTCAGVSGLDVTDGHFSLNASDGVSLGGSTYVQLHGGQVAQNAGNGVHITGAMSNWSVVDVAIGPVGGLLGNTGDAILVDNAASDYYTITGNKVSGNTGGDVIDNGSGNHKMVFGNPGSATDYTMYRDGPTGFLVIRGFQAGYTGFILENGAGTKIFSIDPNGNMKTLGTITPSTAP